MTPASTALFDTRAVEESGLLPPPSDRLTTSATGFGIPVAIEPPSPTPMSDTGEAASSIASSMSPAQPLEASHTG